MTNPYASPNSPVSDPPSQQDGKRPVLVWVIFLFSLFGVVTGALTTVMMATGNFPAFSEAQERFMDSIPLWQHGISLGAIALYLAAAVQLFRMKAAAFTLYFVQFGLSLLMFFVQLANPYYREVMATGFIPLVIGWAISVAIIAYCWRLRRHGRLR
jgi:hypothetical protein